MNLTWVLASKYYDGRLYYCYSLHGCLWAHQVLRSRGFLWLYFAIGDALLNLDSRGHHRFTNEPITRWRLISRTGQRIMFIHDQVYLASCISHLNAIPHFLVHVNC